MKKAVSFLLSLVMCLGLAACGGGNSATVTTPAPTETKDVSQTPEPVSTPEPTPTPEPEPTAIALKIGDKIETDAFSMTFDSMELLPEFSYKTSEYSSTSLYVEDGYQLLLIQGHIENNSTSAFSDSCFARTATVNDAYTVDDYDVRLHFKRDKYFEVDAYTDVDYFLYINVPNKLANEFETATFTLGFNDDMSIPSTEWKSDGTTVTNTDKLYSITGGISSSGGNGSADPADENVPDENTAQELQISIGDKIETGDFDFILNNVELTYEVKPKNTSGVYSSYTADSGKIYVHVDGSYYNKSKRDVCIRDLFIPTVDYDNGYTYTGSAVVDKDDISFTWASSYVVCTPLETCHYHGIVECPEVIESSDASLIVLLEIAGTTYQYTIR